MKNLKTILTAVLLVSCSFSIYSQELKIMSYNIRLDIATDGENSWSNRKDFFTSQIQFYAPDIFGVQEATPNQVTDIASALPSYKFIGIARDGEGKGESCSIYYNPKRLEVKETQTFWLSETPSEISRGWDAAYNRVCTYALFKDVKTKKMFWVFNAHLDHIGNEARIKGVALILQKMKAVNTKDYPIIFMGDLNSEPNTPQILAIKKVMDDTHDVSVEKPFGPSGTFNNFKHNEAVTTRIDYIFISKNSGLTVQKYAVLSDAIDLKYPSDHFAVYIQIH